MAHPLALPVLIWAPDPALAHACDMALAEPGRELRHLADEQQLVGAGRGGLLLVAQLEPRLTAQQAFLRGPMVLIDPHRQASRDLAQRAYAIVESAAAAGLAIDAFVRHRRAAEQVAGRRGSPRRCARCGRGFDAARAQRGGNTTRFIRFGSIALCGGCVEQLRTLLRQQAELSVVEADA